MLSVGGYRLHSSVALSKGSIQKVTKSKLLPLSNLGFNSPLKCPIKDKRNRIPTFPLYEYLPNYKYTWIISCPGNGLFVMPEIEMLNIIVSYKCNKGLVGRAHSTAVLGVSYQSPTLGVQSMAQLDLGWSRAAFPNWTISWVGWHDESKVPAVCLSTFVVDLVRGLQVTWTLGIRQATQLPLGL